MNRTEMHTRYQRSNSEQLEVNAKLFTVIRKRNIPIQEKLEKIQNNLRMNPPRDINAQVGNHNWDTALHFSFKIND
jgi:SUMO ligase MMS21 Smc5/6 complex component